MNFTDQDRQSIQLRERDASGCFCLFFKLDERRGLKLYAEKSVRDQAYEAQRLACELGFGPAVGDACTVSVSPDWQCSLAIVRFGDVAYGYVTELADTNPEATSWKEIENLMSIMRKHNFSASDMSYNNCGRLRDGRLVSIDFDPEHAPVHYSEMT